MNWDDLDAILPNGLHDAELRKLEMDLTKGEIRLEIDFDWCDPDRPGQGGSRRGWLTLHHVVRWLMDGPAVEDKPFWDRPSDMDGGAPDEKVIAKYGARYEGLPATHLQGWFFIDSWNALICWAAKDLSLRLADTD